MFRFYASKYSSSFVYSAHLPKGVFILVQVPEREYLLRVSYMEIYNENILDLLDNGDGKHLQIRDNVVSDSFAFAILCFGIYLSLP